MFGPVKEEVNGGLRKLHTGGFVICTVPNIIGIKSGRMRWAGDVASMEVKSLQGFVRKTKEIVTGLDDRMWIGCIWLKIGTSSGLLRSRQ